MKAASPHRNMHVSLTPIFKDLVLVGGGHSHIAVLKRFGMRPVPGVQLTLVCRDVHTPYSGMLPGLIAGHYTFDDAHIDLRRLATFGGVRFVHAQANGLDLEHRQVLFADRPPISYDLLSLNIGSTPEMQDTPGAQEFAVPVKPIGSFLPRWRALLGRVELLSDAPRIAVVGAGAGGVELALAMQYRLRRHFTTLGRPVEPSLHIFSAAPEILPTHNERVRRKFRRILADRGIQVHTAAPVAEVTGNGLRIANGWSGSFHEVVWGTRASAAPWLAASGLETDDRGFVRVDPSLRSISNPAVYAAGDIAAVDGHRREKAGVFAVRQGPPLEANLRSALWGRAPRPFRPQKRFLGLISTGDQYAVASRGKWSIEGDWVWSIKDWIDRRFMDRYRDLPAMEPQSGGEPAAPAKAPEDPEPPRMELRCKGCASKLGATPLISALESVQPFSREDVPANPTYRDDAAVLDIPGGASMVQSVDFFPAIVEDPYLFGRIAANHALGDIFAMGAVPQSALAIAGIPFGTAEKSAALLRQMLLGANVVFRQARTNLAGGHTSECPELALGFVINGLAEKGHLLRKGGLRPGEALVLTKALGTGVLFAAEMRLQAKGRWIDDAIESMLLSSEAAAKILRKHDASACTDVTGFGLAGHLLEMLEASGAAAEIDLDALVPLSGTLACFKAGVFSSLHPENRQVWDRAADGDGSSSHPAFPLLFDPQTAGGLLAGIPAETASACLAELRNAGYRDATRIGTVREPLPDGTRLALG